MDRDKIILHTITILLFIIMLGGTLAASYGFVFVITKCGSIDEENPKALRYCNGVYIIYFLAIIPCCIATILGNCKYHLYLYERKREEKSCLIEQ